MNYLMNAFIRFGILTEDLDYHLIRAAMVIIFIFFGYQKWFEYETEVLIPEYQQRPSYFLDVSGFRHPRRQLIFGNFGMVVWCAFVLGIFGRKNPEFLGPSVQALHS